MKLNPKLARVLEGASFMVMGGTLLAISQGYSPPMTLWVVALVLGLIGLLWPKQEKGETTNG